MFKDKRKALLTGGIGIYLLCGLNLNCLAGDADVGQPNLRSNINVKAPSISVRVEKQIQENQWESRKYPFIKWKSHPITTAPGMTAQLNTTFTTKKDMFGRGTMKYTLTVSDIPQQLAAFKVQLLDAKGFNLTEFEVAKERFHPIPGTQLLEAAYEHPCKHREYQQARDYLVM
jgi:hypothetical protein